MVTLSKKEARKAALKGKGKAEAAAPPPEASPSPEVDSDDNDESDEDDDGIDEAGLQRLMELVGEEDLDDFERSQLRMEEEDDEEEDGEDDEEDDDEEEEEDAEDDDVVLDEADPDALAVDELGSDMSVDEDAVPQRKVTANNKPAMKILTEGIRMTNTPWPEHLIVQSKTVLDDVDPDDDLKREMAFYKLALDAVPEARKLCNKHDIPFSRPNDYYAEMVKSDEHMERVRTKLVEEAQGIKKSEEAKKQRDLKKYGKQIQVEKLKQREADKKSFNERVQGIKRKRKEGAEIGGEGDDEFGIQVEGDDGDDDHRGGRGRGPAGKSKMPRHARDQKYSLGKSSRRAKQNTRESANDIPGWGADKGKGGKGGKGKAPANRPGKARRHSRRK